MSRINIAFGATEDWLEHTFVTICSILSNAGDDEFKFYIMSDISEEEFNKKLLTVYDKLQNISHAQTFHIEYLKMNNSDFEDVLHDMRVGISALYRLKLSSMTKEDKIIYLDSDLVVLDNISQLWNYNIEDYLLGAVEDKYSALMTYRANLSDDDIYYNSGVLLMNLKKFREQNLEQKIFDKLREENNDYSDQDVLNDICKGQILSLPLKYNLMLSADDENSFPKRKEEYKTTLKSPFILHYSIKPWIIPVQYSEYWEKYNIL